MARVSVTVSQKPKPVNTFKYLRRDEGRLSYTYNPAEVTATPRHASSSTEQTQGARQSLRSAIATDMKRKKPGDPFGEVVVALPRKAPPPNASAEGVKEVVGGSMPFTNTLDDVGVGRDSTKMRGGKSSALSTSFLKRKEEWVDINANAAGQVMPSAPKTNLSSSTICKNGGEEEKGGSTLGSTSNENIEAVTHPPGSAAHERVQLPSQNSYERLGGTDPAPPLSFGFAGGPPAVGGSPYSTSMAEESMMYGGGGLGFPFGRNRSSSVPRRLEEEYGYGNYFHRSARPHSVGSGSRNFHTSGSGSGEEKIMFQLQRELEAARYERQHFLEAKRDLEDESQRFEKFRISAQAELDAAQAQLVVEKSEARREALKDLRAAEERQRTTSTMLEQERENNRRLVRENDLLQGQLSDLTTTMSESQRAQKTEISRLRRDIASLTHRNKELLAMARQQQVDALEGSSTSSEQSVPITASRNSSSGLDIKRNHEQSFHNGNSSSSGSVTGVPRRGDVPSRQRVDVLQKDTALKVEEESRGVGNSSDNRAGSPRYNSQVRGGKPSPSVSAATAPATVSHSIGTLESNTTLTTISNEKKKNNSEAVKTSIPTKEMLLGPEDPIPPVDIPNDVIVSKNALGENSNKCEVLYRSGKREVQYSNGTTKTVLPSGHTILKFVNGDIKRTFPSGRSTYWYEKAQTLHTQLPDGVELFQFLSTGQVERHLPSGEKNILYPDETYKVVSPDGTDKTVTSSGEAV